MAFLSSFFSLLQQILPQYMNEAGYESHMVGKWHLGSHKAAALPNHRGFKSYLGYLHGIDTYYSHKVCGVREGKGTGRGVECIFFLTPRHGSCPCRVKRRVKRRVPWSPYGFGTWFMV